MVDLDERNILIGSLIVFLLFQIVVLTLRWDKPLVWDSSVYVGMGKFLFSGAEIGLWEVFRPPVLPVMAGFLWKSGVFFPNLARIMAISFSTVGLYALYEIVKREADSTVALFTSLITMSSLVFMKWTHYYLTGIPAAFLTFAAIYYASKSKPLRSGLVASLAFLTRFPAGLALPVAGFTLLVSIKPLKEILSNDFDSKEFEEIFKKFSFFSVSFAVLPVVYLGLNHLFGYGFLRPIVAGASVPTLNPEKYLYGFYFLEKAFISNPLLLIAPIGLFVTVKNLKQEFIGYAAGLTAFYGFFTFYPHKLSRFILAFLPLMALFAALGIQELFRHKEEILKYLGPVSSYTEGFGKIISLRAVLVIFLALIFASNAWSIYKINTWDNNPRQSFMDKTSGLDGVVAGLNPAPVVYGDFKFISVRPETYENTSEKAFREANYFVLESCSWYCAPAIDQCKAKKQELFTKLEQYPKIFEKSNSQCRYAVYDLK